MLCHLVAATSRAAADVAASRHVVGAVRRAVFQLPMLYPHLHHVPWARVPIRCVEPRLQSSFFTDISIPRDAVCEHQTVFMHLFRLERLHPVLTLEFPIFLADLRADGHRSSAPSLASVLSSSLLLCLLQPNLLFLGFQVPRSDFPICLLSYPLH